MPKKKKHEPVKAPKGTTKSLFSGELGTPNLEKKLAGLSDAIETVMHAAQKLDQSNLTREAIVILIQHAAGSGKLTKAQINLVLDTMLELGTTYLKKTPLVAKFKEKLEEKLDTVEVSPGCFMSPEAAEKYKGKPLVQVFKDEVKEGGIIDLKGGPLTASMIQEAAEEGAKLGGEIPEKTIMDYIHPEVKKHLPVNLEKSGKPVKMVKKKLAKKKGKK